MLHFWEHVAIAFGVLALLAVYRQVRTKRNAREMLDKVKAIYSGKLEYAEVDPKDYPWVDHGFYQESTEKMMAEGFEGMGDYECLTVSKQYPNMRTFIRGFSGDSGTIIGSVWHVKMRGLVGLVALFGLVRKDVRTIEFETEFDDGTFLDTNNLSGLNALHRFPGVTMNQLDPGTSFEVLLSTHRVSLQEIRTQRSVAPLQLSTMDAILASQDRLHELKSAHRQKVGYVTREEFKDLAGGSLTDEQTRVVEEFEKARDRDEKQDQG